MNTKGTLRYPHGQELLYYKIISRQRKKGVKHNRLLFEFFDTMLFWDNKTKLKVFLRSKFLTVLVLWFWCCQDVADWKRNVQFSEESFSSLFPVLPPIKETQKTSLFDDTNWLQMTETNFRSVMGTGFLGITRQLII